MPEVLAVVSLGALVTLYAWAKGLFRRTASVSATDDCQKLLEDLCRAERRLHAMMQRIHDGGAVGDAEDVLRHMMDLQGECHSVHVAPYWHPDDVRELCGTVNAFLDEVAQTLRPPSAGSSERSIRV